MKKEKKDITIDIFRAVDLLLRQPQNAYPRGSRDDEISVLKDIVYDESLPEVCVLDIYLPPPDKKALAPLPEEEQLSSAEKLAALAARTQEGPRLPLLLYIHGGGFVAGGKQFREGIAKWYASHGVIVLNVNYGLCPDYKYPEPLWHLVRALDFAGEIAAMLHADTNKLLVSGDSAGAYYAAMLAASSSNAQFAQQLGRASKTKVRGCIFDCGLYDIEIARSVKFPLNMDEAIFERFTGFGKKNFEHFWYSELCSPVNFVTSDFPPTFVQYSKKDILCRGQGERLVQKLDECRVPFRYYCSKSLLANHCFPLNWKDSNAKRANAALLRFLADFLDGSVDICREFVTTDTGDEMPETE